MKTTSLIRVAGLAVLFGMAMGASAGDDDESADAGMLHDRAEIERHLEENRVRIRVLADEMGELSSKLADGSVRHIIKRIHADTNRAMLGVSIESRSDDDIDGVIVHAVTPGGPADEAGLESGDVIVAIGGVALDEGGEDEGMQKLMDVMANVEVGDAVDVTYERDGRRQTREVITESLGDHAGAFAFGMHPDVDVDVDFGTDFDFSALDKLQNMGDIGNYQFVWRSGPWDDMELVELTPQLGAYFGVDEGLLVVRAPEDASLGIVDGDVIVRLNGDAVQTPREFTRALSRSKEGDTVSVDVVRQRGAMTLEARVPEHNRTGDIDLLDGDHQIVIKRHYSDSD